MNSNNPFEKMRAFVLSPDAKKYYTYLRRVVLNRWQLKLGCFFLALVLWGVLISSDVNVTRQKTIENVIVTASGADTLQRNGLIVVSGLEDLGSLRMRVDVPQRMYNTVSASNYNVRVDLSRITSPGEQQLPILTTQSSTYGQVTWLSKDSVTVVVDELMTKRRVPVQLNTAGESPAGFYASLSSAKHDPAWVVITGPSSLIGSVDKCVAQFDLSRLAAQPGVQVSSVPFSIYDTDGNQVSSPLISVTSESIAVDSVIVEQRLLPMKTVDIDINGVTTGSPKQGYYVDSVSVSPAYLSIAGSAELLKTLTKLEVSSRIDIEGAEGELIRQIKVEKPQNAEYMSEEAVYLKITILPESSTSEPGIPVGKAP